jgi:hypothetical protein
VGCFCSRAQLFDLASEQLRQSAVRASRLVPPQRSGWAFVVSKRLEEV